MYKRRYHPGRSTRRLLKYPTTSSGAEYEDQTTFCDRTRTSNHHQVCVVILTFNSVGLYFCTTFFRLTQVVLFQVTLSITQEWWLNHCHYYKRTSFPIRPLNLMCLHVHKCDISQTRSKWGCASSTEKAWSCRRLFSETRPTRRRNHVSKESPWPSTLRKPRATTNKITKNTVA